VNLLEQMVYDIGALVAVESPSADLAAVAECGEVLARLGTERLGVAPDRLVADGRVHLRWRLGSGPNRVLLLGHYDTVWPLGSLASHPFEVTDGVLRGPGCFDMKAGLVIALHAAAALAAGCPVTILSTADEEIGSPSSRALIEAEAAQCVAALVLEASADGGALKTARKGVSLYRVRAIGRASHAGLEPERGVNATVELSAQVLAVASFGDSSVGTTVTPTMLTSGTTSNTVPAEGEFTVDVRARDVAEQQRVDALMHGLAPTVPGARLEVTGGPNRPPLPASASRALFERASQLAEGLGLRPLSGVAVGGGSDGNFTAGVGVPTLDGLGAVGGGAHADHEHVLVAELPGRVALIEALVSDLVSVPPAKTPAASGAVS
jgi:glutamate carboxypeptidase